MHYYNTSDFSAYLNPSSFDLNDFLVAALPLCTSIICHKGFFDTYMPTKHPYFIWSSHTDQAHAVTHRLEPSDRLAPTIFEFFP